MTIDKKSKQIQIYLVDDHRILSESLKVLIDAHTDLQIIGHSDNGETAIEEISLLTPDVVILDISMPKMNGIETTVHLKKNHPKLNILILTRHQDHTFLREVLEAGASGYVLKRSAANDLIGAIHAVAAGGSYLDPQLASRLVQNFLGRELPEDITEISVLTKRELEVLKLMAWGHSNKEIAAQLKISVKTVESHKLNSMEKMGFSSRADVVRYAVRQGWLQG